MSPDERIVPGRPSRARSERRLMASTDPEWETFVEFVQSRPPQVQHMMCRWPPLSIVRTQTGIDLLVPAPGVEAIVQGYSESGRLVVTAPVTRPHPAYGWGSATPGQLVNARVWPDVLVLIREERWTRGDVEAALR